MRGSSSSQQSFVQILAASNFEHHAIRQARERCRYHSYTQSSAGQHPQSIEPEEFARGALALERETGFDGTVFHELHQALEHGNGSCWCYSDNSTNTDISIQCSPFPLLEVMSKENGQYVRVSFESESLVANHIRGKLRNRYCGNTAIPGTSQAYLRIVAWFVRCPTELEGVVYFLL